jgi:hypothetical protein
MHFIYEECFGSLVYILLHQNLEIIQKLIWKYTTPIKLL